MWLKKGHVGCKQLLLAEVTVQAHQIIGCFWKSASSAVSSPRCAFVSARKCLKRGMKILACPCSSLTPSLPPSLPRTQSPSPCSCAVSSARLGSAAPVGRPASQPAPGPEGQVSLGDSAEASGLTESAPTSLQKHPHPIPATIVAAQRVRS